VKVRELAGAAEADFVIIVAGDPAHPVKASDTKFEGRLSEREINVYSAAGNFRTELAKKYADRHMGLFGVTEKVVEDALARNAANLIDGAQGLSPHLDRRLPHVRVRPGDGRSGCPRTIPSPRRTSTTWPTCSPIRPACAPTATTWR
jgi:hypothetical protein